MLSGVSPCAICHRISPLFKIDCADASVRRFVNRQPLDGEANAKFSLIVIVRDASGHVGHVAFASGRPGTSPMSQTSRCDGRYAMWVSGS